METRYEFKTISSLEKVFPDSMDRLKPVSKGSMLKNEIHSFQLVGKALCETAKKNIKIEINSPISKYIKYMSVGYVPSTLACYDGTEDENYISKKPGIFPDPLYLPEDKEIYLPNAQARAFWFEIDVKGEISGDFPIEIIIKDEDGNLAGSVTYEIEIIDALLPAQELINTGWFHADCIGVLHNAESMSDKYFELLEKYIKIYARFGHNMILTPIFTPPLDTKVGGERPTTQLVDVTLKDGKYSFEFKNLKRFIDICKRNGIVYYEISHLFTQWGALHAPKITADCNGETKRIFGWETDAHGEEYAEFMKCFLPELIGFLKAEGIDKNCFFHVSDEPHLDQLEDYQKAKDVIAPYIKDYKLIDALSDYEFYKSGAVEKPIVSTNHVKPFLENKVENLWVYYCCGQGEKVANRFMSMPSARNRILGCQLYKYDIEGFLQWGYNFWYSQFSTEVIDPFATTDSNCAFPSGDAFIVYPTGKSGEVIPSLRLYVFNEGLQDLRALKLLESLSSKEEVLALLTEIDGFDKYPCCDEFILDLRSKVNSKIKELI